jgi:hypothetical protein
MDPIVCFSPTTLIPPQRTMIFGWPFSPLVRGRIGERRSALAKARPGSAQRAPQEVEAAQQDEG